MSKSTSVTLRLLLLLALIGVGPLVVQRMNHLALWTSDFHDPGAAFDGDAGGEWSVVREASGWALYDGSDPGAKARVTIDQEKAWRLFTKGVDPYECEAKLEGDRKLGERLLETVSIIA